MIMKNNDWRNDPITERQKIKLRMADEWFTFDRLDKMSKGEAYDYIAAYFDDDGNVNPLMFNKRGKNEIRMDVKEMNRYILKEDVGKWLMGVGERILRREGE